MPLDKPIWTILLVEDEEAVRQVTRHVLESAGYLVLEATGPEQAMAIFCGAEGAINLLLTDIVMPSMDGAELAARLRAMRPNLTTVFMSGYSNATRGFRDAGSPAAYLQKPFTAGMLLSKVAEALSLPPTMDTPLAEQRLPI
jgi:CheY-like chemotaxis protein